MKDAYIEKTLKWVGYLALLTVALLYQWGLHWAIVPTLAGVGLAVVLLLGWSGFVRSLAAARGSAGSAMTMRARLRFLGFALIKYPLVGVLIWWLTRIWTANQLAAFVGGFLLLHVVLVARAVGSLLTEKQ
jgi:hypothetical protein